MTKPQFSTEPSMEDILASIRKMISEERLGPRPIPDQIARSPFGETVEGVPAADSVIDPLEPRLERTSAPAERSQPSFSSLSDALKAATPAPEPRRSLEDKIADMLENGDASPRRPASRTDSLAVFAATRPAPIDAPNAGPLTATPRSTGLGTTPEQPMARRGTGVDPSNTRQPSRSVSRAPDSQLNGVHTREDRTPRVPGSVGPRGAGPGSPTEPRLTEPKLGENKSREPKPSEPRLDDAKDTAKNGEGQRIIAMPSRPGAAGLNGAGTPSVPSPAATALNGAHGASANVASLGLHAVPSGAAGQRPSLRDGDGATGKRPNGDAGSGLSARSSDGLKSSDGLQAKSGDALRGKTKDPAPARDEQAKSALPKSAPAGEMPRLTDAAPQSGASTTAKSTPSDALIDAVVAMVHKEPDTLSVFTSGSAFITGVVGEEPVRKPGPNAARKLDGSAAELLRPMLRQWLSENMPRIVEEALRSEMMSSQPETKDTDEA